MGWWSADEWARMVAGDGCPMCEDAHLPTNVHGELIAELTGSFARLAYNQTQAGYAVVVAKRHAAELFDLTPTELGAFWADVASVAKAIADELRPVKVDYLVMGHLCPHVHCHVWPQYVDDDPHREINPKAGDVRLDEHAWLERVGALRRRLDGYAPMAW